MCAGSNHEYVTEIARWTFSLNPDRLYRMRHNAAMPKIDTLVAGHWRHADAMNELVAMDIGNLSHHTDAYLVFWLPRAKLLFEGDLGYFADSKGEIKASSRAAGLLQAIDQEKLEPATVLQGWAATQSPRGIPMRRFRALVAARAGH